MSSPQTSATFAMSLRPPPAALEAGAQHDSSSSSTTTSRTEVHHHRRERYKTTRSFDLDSNDGTMSLGTTEKSRLSAEKAIVFAEEAAIAREMKLIIEGGRRDQFIEPLDRVLTPLATSTRSVL